MTVKQRTTTRKAIVEKLLSDEYSGAPVLLEELRWKVLIQQYGSTFVRITDAKQKSFTRTIREHFRNLQVTKLRIDYNTPVGLVVRSAV